MISTVSAVGPSHMGVLHEEHKSRDKKTTLVKRQVSSSTAEGTQY